MAPDWIPPRRDVSRVAERFGVNAGNQRKSAIVFAKNTIPKRWKPQHISGGLWDETPEGSFGHMDYTFALRNFPDLVPPFITPSDIDYGSKYLAASKRIRNVLWDWIFKTEAVDPGSTALSGHGIGGGVGHWFINYQQGKFEGTFTVWILPQSRRQATLIASLTESRMTERPTKVKMVGSSRIVKHEVKR